MPTSAASTDEVVFPAEFFDYRLENLAAQLTPGWVRYPSGSFSDAFNWQTGLMVPSWAAQFAGTNIATLLTEAVPWVNGKRRRVVCRRGRSLERQSQRGGL